MTFDEIEVGYKFGSKAGIFIKVAKYKAIGFMLNKFVVKEFSVVTANDFDGYIDYGPATHLEKSFALAAEIMQKSIPESTDDK